MAPHTDRVWLPEMGIASVAAREAAKAAAEQCIQRLRGDIGSQSATLLVSEGVAWAVSSSGGWVLGSCWMLPAVLMALVLL